MKTFRTLALMLAAIGIIGSIGLSHSVQANVFKKCDNGSQKVNCSL